jgi:hypothetical protein
MSLKNGYAEPYCRILSYLQSMTYQGIIPIPENKCRVIYFSHRVTPLFSSGSRKIFQYLTHAYLRRLKRAFKKALLRISPNFSLLISIIIRLWFNANLPEKSSSSGKVERQTSVAHNLAFLRLSIFLDTNFYSFPKQVGGKEKKYNNLLALKVAMHNLVP